MQSRAWYVAAAFAAGCIGSGAEAQIYPSLEHRVITQGQNGTRRTGDSPDKTPGATGARTPANGGQTAAPPRLPGQARSAGTANRAMGARMPAVRPGQLTLPVLGGASAGQRVLTGQNLLLPPVIPPVDAEGRPVPALGDRGTPLRDPNSPMMEPAAVVSPQMTGTVLSSLGLSGIIAPTVLGYTEDHAPLFYGRAPEETAAALPAFSAHRAESLTLKPERNVSLGTQSHAPRVLTFEPAAAPAATAAASARMRSTLMAGRVIPWSSSSDRMERPAAGAVEEPGFRLPRAIQSMMNVNLHVGMGIPSATLNFGALTSSYLGLSGVYNYLSPDVADRLQGQYYQQPRRP